MHRGLGHGLRRLVLLGDLLVLLVLLRRRVMLLRLLRQRAWLLLLKPERIVVQRDRCRRVSLHRRRGVVVLRRVPLRGPGLRLRRGARGRRGRAG
jgi:hypothetical protein